MTLLSEAESRPQIVIATHNVYKFKELDVALAPLRTHNLPLRNWRLKPAPEIGTTFVENALVKARYACQHTRLPAVADDSGLVVDVLDGEPGVHSSRYAGEHATDSENNVRLLARIAKKHQDHRPVSARFVAILVYLEHENDPTPCIAEGCWQGSIATQPRGKQGFGYDPIFLPCNASRTVAELGPAVKQRESHRAVAARELVHMMLERGIVETFKLRSLSTGPNTI